MYRAAGFLVENYPALLLLVAYQRLPGSRAYYRRRNSWSDKAVGKMIWGQVEDHPGRDRRSWAVLAPDFVQKPA